jgi:hypothetical protein
LESIRVHRFIATSKSRNNDVVSIETSYETLYIKVGSCVADRLWIWVGLLERKFLCLIEFFLFLLLHSIFRRGGVL